MKCKLYPYKRKDIAGVQELTQHIGWQITAFNLPKAWAVTEGDGVTIAIVDTGCDLDHPDLAENLLEGYNVLKDGPPEDDNDHGTVIAGIICAKNDDLGIVGVAPKAQVIPIKVLDEDGLGDLENVAKGIDHAVERKVDMICLSLGSLRPLAKLRRSIQAATKQGIPVFCSGGNISKSQDSLYPARYPETIAIAALDKSYQRANFSNTGKINVDFLAPGSDIMSTIRDGWYAVFSGSSMAVPFAASCCALALSAKRKHNLNISLTTVDDYRDALRKYAVDPNHARYKGEAMYMGFGIIEPELMIDWLNRSYPSKT